MATRQQLGSERALAEHNRGFRKDMGSRYEALSSSKFAKEGRSYAEAVREPNPHKKDSEVGMKEQVMSKTMSWEGSYETEEWLSRSAVGVLKNFSSVESVNQKLDDRGFKYSSTFQGGKNIVWVFQSNCERDGFVKNRFLWNDCFLSMKVWQEQHQPAEIRKISWVEVHGVPLNCWCNEFFKKVGGLLGEVLWIDKVTEARQRLDIGRLLVQSQWDQQISCDISVRVGRRSLLMKIVECPTPAIDEWVNTQLGLRSSYSNLNQSPEKVVFDPVWKKARRVVSSEEDSKLDYDRVGDREDVSNYSRDKKEFLKGVRKPQSWKNFETRKEAAKQKWDYKDRKNFETRKEVGGKEVALDKGKGRWCQKLKATNRLQSRNGTIRIGSQRMAEIGDSSEDSENSSFEFESEIGLRFKEECSKKKSSGRVDNNGPRNGPKVIGPSVSEDSKLAGKRTQVKLGRICGDCRGCGDSRETGSSDVGSERSNRGLSVGEPQNSLGNRDISSIQMVPETQFTNEQGINIVVDLRSKDREEMDQVNMVEGVEGDGLLDKEKGEHHNPVIDSSHSESNGGENIILKKGKKTRGKEEEIVEYVTGREREEEDRMKP
ncbi:hypothetical protein Q3G72_026436 [Acer saccharum]|nr:hypothetical protein Q3G72_026436 [Acer saccharum]